MSEQYTDGSERHNPESWKPLSLTYDQLGGGMLRTHISISHKIDEHPPQPMHIPVDRDGVVA